MTEWVEREMTTEQLVAHASAFGGAVYYRKPQGIDARTLAELQERRRVLRHPSSDTVPSPVTVRDEETQAQRPGLLCASEVSE